MNEWKNEKMTEWRDRVTWPEETRRNAMVSLNYLYLKVTRCSACTLLGCVQVEQGCKLMRKRARKRSNYKNHAPGLTQSSGNLAGRHIIHVQYYYECRTWGRSLWVGPEEEPGGGAWGEAWASPCNWGVPLLYNSGTCKWPLGEEPNWSVCHGRVYVEGKSFFQSCIRGCIQKLPHWLSTLLVSSDISKDEGQWHDWTSNE